MAQPRTKIFGPLFYSTLVLAFLVVVYTAILAIVPALEERRELRRLVESLRSQNLNERETAASALAMREIDGRPSPYLVEATRDPRPEVRSVAIRTLSRVYVDLKSVIPLLNTATGDPDQDVRLAAAEGFGSVAVLASQTNPSSPGSPGGLTTVIREELLKALRLLLKDPEELVRVAAVDSLRDFGTDPATAADFAAAMDDKERSVRIAASRALLKINGAGDPAAVRMLLDLLSEPEPIGDRSEVATILNGTNAEVRDRAVAALIKTLAVEDPSVRQDVMDSLIVFGRFARPAVPALDLLLKDPDHDLRAAAGRAISAIEGKESPRYLSIQIDTIINPNLHQDLRLNACVVVSEVNAPALAKATPSLIRQLAHPNPVIRGNAYELLGLIIVFGIPAQLPESSNSN